VAYSAGLMGFTMVKVLAPGYFARQNTSTPVRIGLIALGSTITINVLLVVPWALSGGASPHAGLAASTSLGSFINAGLLYRGLRRAGVVEHSSGWSRFLLQVAVASVLMSIVLVLLSPATSAWLAAGLAARYLWLAAAVAGGVVIYGGALLAMGLRPADIRLHRANN
jgi:putative peptidoglycan lipid II flippase